MRRSKGVRAVRLSDERVRIRSKGLTRNAAGGGDGGPERLYGRRAGCKTRLSVDAEAHALPHALSEDSGHRPVTMVTVWKSHELSRNAHHDVVALEIEHAFEKRPDRGDAIAGEAVGAEE